MSRRADVFTLPLYEGPAPGALGAGPEDVPTLTVYPAQAPATGAAMVVCPGGGYGNLAPHEQEPVARWLAGIGVTAAVLRYRIGPRYNHPRPMEDGQHAIRALKVRGAEWGVDPARVGILGFSAGGHLAASVLTLWDAPDVRPDLGVLIYPVVTMTEAYGHAGSRRNLLGENPDTGLMERLSTERQINADTPPCFLVHTAEDAAVPVENSLAFARALGNARVPFELHVFPNGPHGFGMAEDVPVLGTWPDLCAAWLRTHSFAR